MSLVVDSSAVMAFLLDEPEATAIELALADSEPVVMSAATFVETSMVAERRLGAAGALAFDRLRRVAEIEIVPVDEDLAADAVDAWRRFGKGRHPAKLNFGDCFSYALTSRVGGALLCVGDDFPLTDIEVLPL